MSYVIQNSFQIYKTLLITPRFKNFFFLRNTKIFIYFFFKNSNQFFHFCFKYHIIFFQFLFSDKFVKFFKKLDLNIFQFNSNKQSYSYIYWSFFINFHFFKKNTFYKSNNNFLNIYLYNSFLIPFKFINKIIKNKIFQNVFFFLFQFFSLINFSNNFFFKYSNNFTQLFENTYTLSFFNGYFFNVYII